MLVFCILKRSLHVHLSDHCAYCPLAVLAHRLQSSILLLPNNFTRFSKVSTRNIFTFLQPQPELVLKLFLIFGISEPHCSHKVMFIKKRVASKMFNLELSKLGNRYSCSSKQLLCQARLQSRISYHFRIF